MSERYQRNRRKRRKASDSLGRALLVLLICATAITLCFPTVRMGIKDRLSGIALKNIDYKGIVSAISDGFTGKTAMKDMLNNVVECISKANDNAVLVSTVVEDTPKTKTATQLQQEKDEKVAAFVASKEEFSELELPALTTYQMGDISISHTAPMSGTVTSDFGYRHHPVSGDTVFHYGTDIGGVEGESIVSFADGTVTSVSDSSTYGKNVTVAHESGIETMYAHCGEITVSVGDTVKMGDVIAKCGSTGNATSACLHFELKMNGVYFNPGYYL